MPEGRERTARQGQTKNPSPRSGVYLGNGRGSGPGLTSSSAFGSVAQGPAGRVGCGGTRGPWNTGGRAAGEDMPRKPLGPEQTICQAQDATRPEGGSQTQTIAIRKNRQGACRLARPPLSVQRRCGVRQRPNPADAPHAIVTRKGRSQGPGRP